MSILTLRSELLRSLRNYFYRTGAQEVVTPVLRDAGTSEVHLHNLTVDSGEETRYLQTSPEYAMKCLLAQYREDIFQICPAIRGGESGRRHQTEFTMLEWYRCDIDLAELALDVRQLWAHLGESVVRDQALPGWDPRMRQVTYAALWTEHIGINPHQASRESLLERCREHNLQHVDGDASEADCLDALFSSLIEPTLVQPTIVTHFPECQASLSELGQDEEGNRVCLRFELYARGIELANAYQELVDADELKARFDANNRQRTRLGFPRVEDDEALLQAMQDMPRSSGIALGVDRLAMCLLGESSLASVTP